MIRDARVADPRSRHTAAFAPRQCPKTGQLYFFRGEGTSAAPIADTFNRETLNSGEVARLIRCSLARLVCARFTLININTYIYKSIYIYVYIYIYKYIYTYIKWEQTSCQFPPVDAAAGEDGSRREY